MTLPRYTTRTVFPSNTTRQFDARFAGIDSVSKMPFYAGEKVTMVEDTKAIVTVRTLREWDFRLDDGASVSNFQIAASLTEQAIREALAAGAEVTVMGKTGETKSYTMNAAGEVSTYSRTYRTFDIWWKTTASKALAFKVRA